MSDFTLDDAAQLINYYKQRVSDLEYQVLQLQIQINKVAHTHDSLDQKAEASNTKIEK